MNVLVPSAVRAGQINFEESAFAVERSESLLKVFVESLMLNVMKSSVAILIAIFLSAAVPAIGTEPRAFQESPESFFGHRPLRPTLLVTIGLSGTGKTFWSEIGQAAGWEHIEVDAVIAKEVSRGTSQEVAALESKSLQLRLFGQSTALGQANALLNEKRSFIWDSLGLDQTREEVTKKAKSKGFEVWWLVFQPEDWRVARGNILYREYKNGSRKSASSGRCSHLARLLKDQSDQLEKLLAEIRKTPSRGPDRIFFARVPDLRAQLPGGDPCVGTDG